jgi:hypothetical protein
MSGSCQILDQPRPRLWPRFGWGRAREQAEILEWLCNSKIRLIVFGESSRTPSASPPQATADWMRATERALPWPLVVRRLAPCIASKALAASLVAVMKLTGMRASGRITDWPRARE